MKLKLSHSLYLGFSIIVATTLALAYIVWSIVDKSEAVSREVESDDVPGVLAYLNVLDEIGDLQTDALKYMNGSTKEADEFRQNSEEFKHYYSILRPLESSKASDIEKMDKILSLTNQYIAQVNSEVFAKYSPDQERLVRDNVSKLIKNVGIPLENLLDELKEQEFEDAYKTTNLEESLNDDLPGVRYYLELVDEGGDMLSSLNGYIAGEPGAQEAFAKDAQTFAHYLEALRPLEQKPNEVRDLKQIEDYYNEIVKVAQEVFQSYNPYNKMAAIELLGQLKESHISVLEDILDTSSQEEKNDAVWALGVLNDNMNSIIFWLGINVISVVIIGAFVAWWLTNSVNKRIGSLVTKARAIASGNLSASPIADSNQDELGDLARAIDEMQISLRNVMTDIASVATEVANNTQTVDAMSREVASGIQEQADKATLIASAVEEMTVTVKQVADQSQEAAASARLAGDEATNGGKLMQETVNGMNRISSVVNETAETVDSLGKRGEEIGNVIKVINDIAEQTNLLALNAAIEAARAGDLGRGFAVVADEVRGLAERTSKATEEVGGLITSIQQETRQAVERMSEGTQLVGEGVSLSNSAGQALTQIVSRAQDVNHMIEMIANAGNEQATATAEMSRDISTISQIADSSVRSTQDGAKAVNLLYKKVEELEAVVARFKL
ncbi:methyl-accepting chemotaxis protein [Vibrio vulnificus]|uniref:methyl-accepting chemotaxis protein n=1 Tax=Vibrio vulnificus TaxID=672 RepID=UPI00102A95E4|nr:methyl-accepting chemotaxis protein [Vibrio vulnificus]EGQ9933779.1 methyl-accepting chemotaxis protein [Vibrio vulnificus]EGR0232336.1 methyl-accepting chemotaxis protein [Vibrio vulnificus]ELI0608758.1 methyl-accepting chemotaxis protein [Vibrio vulnificus]MCU8271200.1 methyl-accepting chemotaxis protein [Vibrio vulnificus]RZQ18074.1 methyl-accepting chemotaxis protein [Vibrio vulnificus]